MKAVGQFFDAFCVIFRAPPVCPGVERQFFELLSTHTCECSRAPWGAGVAGSLLPGDSASGLPISIGLCGYTHCLALVCLKQQQQQQQQQQQYYNLGRLRFNRRGASTPLWGVEACSPPSRRPNPIPTIPPHVVRTPHLHGAPTTEETFKL